MTGATNMLISIVEFVLALGFLAFLHEMGHFLITRLFKIQVEEFGFGIPPRIVKLFSWGGTDFTLNWIPFGAFVRPKGENDPEIKDGLGAASPWKRLAMLLGGPVMNILTGVILFIIVLMQIGAADTSKVIISSTVAGSPAAQAGLLPNDLILKVDGQPVDSADKMTSIINANLGKQITIELQRDGQVSDITAIPRTNPPQGQGPLGVTISNPRVPITFGKAIKDSIDQTGAYINLLLALPGRMIQGTISPDQSRIVGPVGMFTIFNQERSADIQSQSSPTAGPAVNVLNFLAVISVALGFTNLLPIPALDGGRILFLIPELLFRKRVPPRYENAIHAIGLFALIMLLVLVTAQDIINPVTLPK